MTHALSIGASEWSYTADGRHVRSRATMGTTETFAAPDTSGPKQVSVNMRGVKNIKLVPNDGSLVLSYKEVARVARFVIPKNTQVKLTVYLDLEDDTGMQKWLNDSIKGPDGAVGVDLLVRGGISLTAHTLDQVASFRIPPKLGEWMEAVASAFEGCTTNNGRTLKMNPYLKIASKTKGTAGFKLGPNLIRQIRKSIIAASREKLPPPIQLQKTCASGTLDQLGNNLTEALNAINKRSRTVPDAEVDAAYQSEP